MSHYRLVEFTAGAPAQIEFDTVRGLPELPPESLVAGTECLLLKDGDVACARVSIGVAHDLVGAPGATGMIGHYEALDAAAGVALLGLARGTLARRGVARILGPMNGSTWARYRLAMPREPGAETFDAPVFAGEPRNPDRYAADFAAAGFEAVAHYESDIEYFSSAGNANGGREPEPATIAPVGDGVAIRPFDATRFDEELAALHAVSLEGFRDNLYYAPLSLEAFRAIYEPSRGRFDPRLVLLAESAPGRVLGYAFNFPDPLSAQGGVPSRVVFKTLAVVPAARGLRLGSRLFDASRAAATAGGYGAILYALMRSDNVSRGMAQRRAARLFRRYALFGATA